MIPILEHDVIIMLFLYPKISREVECLGNKRKKMMDIEKMLEFNTVKEQWENLALTLGAKEQIRECVPFLKESDLRKELKETTQARSMIEQCGTPPLVALSEMREILIKAKSGECLSIEQLENVGQTLVGIRRLKDYLQRGVQLQIPLAYYEENLVVMDELREEIEMQIRNSKVDDHASKLLFDTRYSIERLTQKIREKTDLVLRANKEFLSDQFSTFRAGRLCIPVKKEYKSKISGSVLDQSSSGSTVFVQPSSTMKYYEEMQTFMMLEENEVHRILYTLTAMIADQSESMKENIRFIEKLDYIFSKGKLSIDMEAVEPQLNTDRVIQMENARHPLMNREECIPIQFEIGGDVQGIIITGPNTGGKTVAIKTVALNCMMAQCGLHVACTKANITMSSNYLCDIGDGQNLAENLSTFSAHIKNVLSILQDVSSDSLVIMDELGSGTDPMEGMGIAIAILEELRKSGCLFLVTTHYPEVKTYAERTKGMKNAKMAFDQETLRPLYQMVMGEAGESCAFYVAQKLGMPEEMLDVAVSAATNRGEIEIGKQHSSNHRIVGSNGRVKIQKTKTLHTSSNLVEKFQLGDSVMVYPDHKIGIVCQTVNEKGTLQVQLKGKKIWINHKRVKLHVAADQLYPEDYDFSIIFDSVEQRKVSHEMDRKYTDKVIEYDKN